MSEFETCYSATAVISVRKIINNIKAIKKYTKGSKFIAVVKADAYGHGLELARYIEKYSDAFAVGKLEEAITLRYLGVKKPVMLLLPLEKEFFQVAVDYDITLLCENIVYAKFLSDTAKESVKINLKVDCGMKRLGFDNEKEFIEAVKLLKCNKNINIYSIYSHFSCASNLKRTHEEFNVFNKITSKVDEYTSTAFKHISASGGLVYRKFNIDAVRVGLLMYGYKPFNCDINVQPALKIVAEPIKKRFFEQNEKCLYNAKAQTGENYLFGFGYGDGLFRNYYPIRCMNLSYQKDKIILDDANKIADNNQTISYEVLVNSTKNIKKKYVW